MVDVFENAVSISIHDKDVRSIKTIDGIVVWEKPVQTTTILVFSGDAVSFGQNIVSNGDVTVDWGDGTTEIINNPTTNISHTYSDGETTHTVILDGEITSFGNRCFYNSSNLNEITIPNTVTSLGDYCFASCGNLTSIDIPSSVVSVGIYCFSGTKLSEIPPMENVSTLGAGCFHYCLSLVSAIIPSSVTSIGEACFNFCPNLTTVMIHKNVASIGINSFYQCPNVSDYEFYWEGDSVITYTDMRFGSNANTEITIPNGSTNDYIAKDYPADKLVERSE